jgi:hypothetical protein
MSKKLVEKLSTLDPEKLDEILNQVDQARTQRERKKLQSEVAKEIRSKIDVIPRKDLTAIAKRVRSLSKPIHFKTTIKPTIEVAAVASWNHLDDGAFVEFEIKETKLNTDLFGDSLAQGIIEEMEHYFRDYLEQLSYDLDDDNSALTGLKRRNDAISNLLNDLNSLAEKYGVEEDDIWNHLVAEGRI